MTAKLRNWYLSTLGITRYVGRSSGSIPVVEGDVDSLSEISATTADKRAARIAVEFDAVKAAPNAEPQLKEQVVVQPERMNQVQFRLACWQPVEDLLVLDTLTPGEQPGVERVQLLSNLLRAIQRLPDQGLSPAELIDWPTIPGGSSDEKGAHTLLSAFLEARIKRCGVCWVLLLGREAAAYIDPSRVADIEQGTLLELSSGAKAVVLHNLADMLEQASLKLDNWRAIEFLSEY